MSYSASNAAAAASQRAVADDSHEFAFSEADFRSLAQLAYERAGIVLAEGKRNLVYSRVSRRLRILKLSSFREYREFLAGHEPEVESFINSISTNHTKFFRESHHFDHLRTHVAMPFARDRSAGGRLRVWSAGCSTGEEPYTIAAVLCREIRDVEQRDVRILATDIDTDVLGKASAGEYQRSAIDEVPKSYQEYFAPVVNERGETVVQMDDGLRSLIRFNRLNLMDSWPFQGLFDAIFCRNVMIYFDGPTKVALIDRFIRQIKPGGWLYIGHSESLIGGHQGLELVGRTIYRRTE